MAELTSSSAGHPAGSVSTPVSPSRPGPENECDSAPSTWNWKEGLARDLPKYSPVVRQSTGEPIGLSFGQLRIWMVSNAYSSSIAYNVPLAWRLTGAVDVDALSWGLREIVRRHEALRTCFRQDAGQLVQCITEESISLTIADLRSSPVDEREADVQRRIAEEIRRPFDLTCDVMLHAALFRVADEQHVLVLTVHHIASDGPAMGVLLEELSHLYSAVVAKVAPSLPEPRMQSRDFTVWQREALTDKMRGKQLAYWKQQLKGAPPTLELPSDCPRAASASFYGGIEYRTLSKQLSDDFKSLARGQGVTRFMALLAAFQALLYRYSGQPDVVVGAAMTHRIREETSKSIGFFSNMMALRTQLHDDPPFRDLLKRVRGVSLGAYAHQDVPFEAVVAELRPERAPGRNPLFQVILNYEDSVWHDLHLAGVQAVELPVHNGAVKFDLSLCVVDRPEGFHLSLEYNSDLLDAETVRRMLGSFETLVQAAVADPNCRVSQLPLLTEGEREELLSRWNQTQEDYPRDVCIHELFEAQVQRTPEATAIEFEGQRLTYRELNTRANRLARYLVRRGVGPEVLAGICVERSFEMVIAMIAVLKAGGAYVPLDPAHPAQRRLDILMESGARLLITQEEVLKTMALPDSLIAVRVDSDWPEVAAESAESPPSTARPDNLAYVIYTSGSTGRPKGVQIEHRSVVNSLCAMRKRPGMTADDVVLAITTITFDPSVLELLLPLTVGARMVIVTREEVTDVYRLLEAIRRSAATLLQATPTTWQMLLAAGWQGDRRLTALCGGESLSRGLADQLLQRCGSVWNLYGPTETTVWSTFQRLGRADMGTPGVGFLIDNARAYVLDQHYQPTPLGVAGELYIGGDGLARGYQGAEQLTAEKFVADPFSVPGSRLYRTGDLVRQRHDGSLEFLGRVDRQVKVRGHRIEPGEVETTLTQYPGVRRAAVVARDAPGGKILVAYLEPHAIQPGADAGSPPLSQGQLAERLVPALRRFLRQRLPEYMVPSAFVTLEALPLTASGKLDVKALPAPDEPRTETILAAPRDPLEERLLAIWEETLNVRLVGVTDNFFDLGGHSVLGASLLAQVDSEFGKRLPLATLFQAPTVEQLASILRQDGWLSPWLVQIQAGNSSKPPLFFVQARMGYRALAAELGSDQPVYAVPYDRLYENQTERTMQDIATELSEKIRNVQPHGPYYLGGVCLAGRVAYAIAREMWRQGEEVALLTVFDSAAPGYEQRSRIAHLRYKAGHVKWHLQRFVYGDRQLKQAFFMEMRWHLINRLWWTGNNFFRWTGLPLPGFLRQQLRLTARAAITDSELTPYPGHVAVFRPAERPKGAYDDPALGWKRIAAGGVDVFEIPGDHKHVLLPPNVSTVAQHLKTCLHRAQAKGRQDAVPSAA